MFDIIGIVGAGLLGGSFGLEARMRGLARRVVAITRSERTARDILARGAADDAATDMAALRDADLVMLAAPVRAIIAGMSGIAEHTRHDAIVTDMGSTKSGIVAAGEAALGGRFVGGHPMCGSHESGVAAAREGLFQGATWVITPTERTDPRALGAVNGLALALEARPVQLDLDRHDTIAAAVSHMPHVVAAAITLAVARLAEGDPRFADLAGGGLRDMTRIAASPPDVWRDILATNREPTLDALRAFRDALDDAIAAMRGDEAIEALFVEAGAARKDLVRDPTR